MKPILFTNARFITLQAGTPDPRVLLARNGRIEALGHEAGLGVSDCEVVDLGGRTAIPGPVDAHCHLVSYGMQRLREADLRGARSLAEIGERLRAHARGLGLRPGDGRWLLGRGFEQDLLAEARWPTRQDLDAVAGEIPVRITRVCGHAVAANTAALKAAGLDPEDEAAGFPQGVLCEDRIAPIYRAIPAPTDAEWRKAAEWACLEAARVGFVGVHSLMAHEREIRALVDLRRDGLLPVRVRMQLPYALLEHATASGLRTGFGDDYLRIGAVKLFSDGSLGARTAALHAPYSDDPSTDGELIYAAEELAARVRRVYETGFQVCVHAIGDRAMDVTLDAMEAAAAAYPPAFPPRIEHASLVNPAIVERMRRLGVGAAIQPQFARSDYWAPERLGPERARGCYAFRTLRDAGIPLAGSTDCPVEELDAMAAIGQAVSRPEWSPGEALPLEAALRTFSEGTYLIDGAPAGTGRLAPGEFADFVVLDQDPRAVPAAELERIPVAMTVVGGRVICG
jgi:predicted amidohydrolase YtcJ